MLSIRNSIPQLSIPSLVRRFAFASETSSTREYASQSVVSDYAQRETLQKPESQILADLTPYIAENAMLDIGVGGGRTTVHFAPIAKKYVGLDFSREMVEACQTRFPGQYQFDEGDVREMSQYETGSFGFVLFSYNGLDYIQHRDRGIALREIARLLSPDGVFCFSTHNIHSVHKLFDFRPQLTRQVRELADRVSIWAKLRSRTPTSEINRIRSADHAYFFDGYRDTYYIRPETQLQQLKEAGFKNPRVFSLHSGREYQPEEVAKATDSWLYFVAEKA